MSAFVYGTLMFPEVLQALINRVPRMEPAHIVGYQRYRIRGQVFPGTIRSVADARVRGLVLLDLQPQELEMLDEFEGDEYYKEPVRAVLEAPASGGGAGSGSPGGGSSGEGGLQAAVDTIAYIWQDSLRGHLYGDWDPEQFRQQELGRYVEMCRGFAADVQQQRNWKGAFQPSSSSSSEEGEGEEQQQGGGDKAAAAAAAAAMAAAGAAGEQG